MRRGFQVASITVAMVAAGACAGEVQWDRANDADAGAGAAGEGGAGGAGKTGGGAEPTDCDGCRVVYQIMGDPFAELYPCPGALTQAEELEACMCAECGYVCGDCYGEPVEDMKACQNCWESVTGCDELGAACAADDRQSSKG